MLSQGVDGVYNQCNDYVDAVGLMLGNTGLEKKMKDRSTVKTLEEEPVMVGQ